MLSLRISWCNFIRVEARGTKLCSEKVKATTYPYTLIIRGILPQLVSCSRSHMQSILFVFSPAFCLPQGSQDRSHVIPLSFSLACVSTPANFLHAPVSAARREEWCSSLLAHSDLDATFRRPPSTTSFSRLEEGVRADSHYETRAMPLLTFSSFQLGTNYTQVPQLSRPFNLENTYRANFPTNYTNLPLRTSLEIVK